MYITWEEFYSYFKDYKEIEERNKKVHSGVSNLLNNVKSGKLPVVGPEEELQSLLETETLRRLK